MRNDVLKSLIACLNHESLANIGVSVKRTRHRLAIIESKPGSSSDPLGDEAPALIRSACQPQE
jgi:hypothetical protein